MDGTFFPKNDYRSYLAHHGIKGMKWGVRHDKDYLSYRKFRKNRKQKERENF